jgi:hypothetical protein
MGNLSEAAISAFRLSPSEVARVKALLAATQKSMAELEAKNAVIEPPRSEGEIRITVAPFPAEGGKVYDTFQQALHEILGDERFSLYNGTFRESMERLGEMSGFGLIERSITIEPNRSAENWNSQFDAATGVVKVNTKTSPRRFMKNYAKLYERMVAEGAWPYPSRSH